MKTYRSNKALFSNYTVKQWNENLDAFFLQLSQRISLDSIISGSLVDFLFRENKSDHKK